VTWPAQRLKVTVFIGAAMGFGFDVVDCRCWYRPAVLHALLADMSVTLKDAGTENVPLAPVSTLMTALSTLMLLPAFIAVSLTVSRTIGCCLTAAKLPACARDS
jgi:hypothetical protein